MVQEADGMLGTVCICQASGLQAIREHASRAGMPADGITPVEATVVIREDPKEDAAAA
jgi:hypothetical protein